MVATQYVIVKTNINIMPHNKAGFLIR